MTELKQRIILVPIILQIMPSPIFLKARDMLYIKMCLFSCSLVEKPDPSYFPLFLVLLIWSYGLVQKYHIWIILFLCWWILYVYDLFIFIATSSPKLRNNEVVFLARTIQNLMQFIDIYLADFSFSDIQNCS